MCKRLQGQSSMDWVVCLQREGGLHFSPVECCIKGFMNVHCGSDLPMNHHGFGAAGKALLHLAENLLKIWMLSLAVRWLDMETSDFRQESTCKNVVIFCTSPAQSTAQLEATHGREGHVPPNSSIPLQAVFCGMFIAPLKWISPVRNEFSG